VPKVHFPSLAATPELDAKTVKHPTSSVTSFFMLLLVLDNPAKAAIG
jgi:hypothetical protein